MADQKAWLSYEIKNYTYLTIWLWTNRDEWAPKDRTDWSDLWQNIILTLWSYFGGASTFSQLGSRVYWRLEAAGPLRCACVEVFFPTDKHSVVVAETGIHHSFMTRAIAVWWSEREVCNKVVGLKMNTFSQSLSQKSTSVFLMNPDLTCHTQEWYRTKTDRSAL